MIEPKEIKDILKKILYDSSRNYIEFLKTMVGHPLMDVDRTLNVIERNLNSVPKVFDHLIEYKDIHSEDTQSIFKDFKDKALSCTENYKKGEIAFELLKDLSEPIELLNKYQYVSLLIRNI